MHYLLLFYYYTYYGFSNVLWSLYQIKSHYIRLNRLLTNAIHSMRRGAGRGKLQGPKRLPISLGFKCAHCSSEFESRHAMHIHRRHVSSVGRRCSDPRDSKSMSFTERGDQFAGSLRRHDTPGVLPMPAFVSQKMLTSPTENSAIMAIIAIRVIIAS